MSLCLWLEHVEEYTDHGLNPFVENCTLYFIYYLTNPYLNHGPSI